MVGINVALRISDLLTLTWYDVLNDNRRTFKSINLREGKTKKKRNIELNKASQKVLSELKKSFGAYVWWFNNERLHSTLNYMPPVEYRKQHSL